MPTVKRVTKNLESCWGSLCGGRAPGAAAAGAISRVNAFGVRVQQVEKRERGRVGEAFPFRGPTRRGHPLLRRLLRVGPAGVPTPVGPPFKLVYSTRKLAGLLKIRWSIPDHAHARFRPLPIYCYLGVIWKKNRGVVCHRTILLAHDFNRSGGSVLITGGRPPGDGACAACSRPAGAPQTAGELRGHAVAAGRQGRSPAPSRRQPSACRLAHVRS